MNNHNYKDIHRVEDGIIPALLSQIALHHLSDPRVGYEAYETLLKVSKEVIDNTVKDLHHDKKHRIFKRLNRVTYNIVKYMVDQKFTTRKMFLTVTAWNESLQNAKAVYIEPDSNYDKILKWLDEIILGGYKTVENFDKVDASAINHVPKIHKLAQKEGYFL